MHKLLLAAGLAACTCVPAVSAADDHYLRAGYARTATGGDEIDSDDRAFTVGVGWRFGDHFSLETGYNDLGDYPGAAPAVGGPMDLRVTSLEFGIAGKLPFGGSRWFGQARLGAHRWENKWHNFEAEYRETGVDPYYGLGLGYQVAEHFDVLLSAERYGADDVVGDLDRLMLSIEVR